MKQFFCGVGIGIGSGSWCGTMIMIILACFYFSLTTTTAAAWYDPTPVNTIMEVIMMMGMGNLGKS